MKNLFRRLLICSCLSMAVFPGGEAYAGLVPEGPEILVNQSTGLGQIFPRAAAAADGRLVVAWVSRGGPTPNRRDLLLRRFDADGLPEGNEVPITFFSDASPSGKSYLGVDLADNIVIAFRVQQPFTPGIYSDIFYRKLLPDGSSTGISGVVSPDNETNFIGGLGVSQSGAFVVAWDSCCEGPIFELGAYSQFVSDQGAEEEGPIFHHNLSSGIPSVTATLGGEFLVAWLEHSPRGAGLNVVGQWLEEDGTEDGPPVEVALGGSYLDVLARSQPEGVGLLAWEEWEDGVVELRGRRLSREGLVLGSEFSLLEFPLAGQEFRFFFYDIAVFPNGEFVAVWTDQPGDGTPTTFWGRHFSQDGTALTSQISLSLPSFSHETRPSLAVGGPDKFWLVWENTDGRDGAENGIFAQRYRITREPLFSDGFESGDLLAWSASVP